VEVTGNRDDSGCPEPQVWLGSALGSVDHFTFMPESWQWSPHAIEVMRLANNSLRRFDHSYVSSPHLILGLLKLQKGGASHVLKKAGLSVELVERFLSSRTDSSEAKTLHNGIPLGESARTVLVRADVEARSLKHTYLTPVHLFLGLLMEETGGAADLLASLHTDLDRMGQDALEFDGYGPPKA
jgi:ATP-dependent Clp protease ATP-binding subunit ClpC